jgi:hypothetical protein
MAEDHARAEITPAHAKREGPISLAQLRGPVLPPLDLQQLWFLTLRWEWSSLVLVPADSKGSVLRIAKGLAQVGNRQGGRDAARTDGTSHSSGAELVEDITGQFTVQTPTTGGERWKQRTIIALDPVVTDPAGVPVAVAADAVLLFVELGKTNIAEAQRTIQLIGRDRFRGCVLIK